MRAAEIKDGVVINFAEVEEFFGDFIDPLDSVLGSTWDGVAFTAPEPVAYVPQEVSMAQAQEALYDAGLLDSVDAAIDAMEGELGDKARIRWGKSPTVRRDSSWVLALSPILGLTSEKLDELFIAASKL